jgi:hypothetical protein
MEVYTGFKNTDSNLNTITDLIFSIKQSLSLALQRIVEESIAYLKPMFFEYVATPMTTIV